MTETASDTTRNSRPLTRSRSTAFALSALILLGLMVPLPAHAACTTPVGEAGDQFFNTTVSRMQYCDGTNWVNMGVSALSDNLGNHTASQALAMDNFKIIGLATPTDATDAVTKSYVDGLIGGGGDNLGDHIATTVLRSDTNNTDDLGTSAIRWKDGWFAGAVTAGTFSGVGTSLTALNASNLGSGTVPTARLGTGTANSTTFLRGDNTWAIVAGGGGGSDFQQFNTSGTWTKPATGNLALIECWGGGGSGAKNGTRAGGGGGGAYVQRFAPLSLLPASVTVTIGAGAVGATVASTSGAVGETTNFGTFVAAYGGGGGSGSGGGGGGGITEPGNTSAGQPGGRGGHLLGGSGGVTGPSPFNGEAGDGSVVGGGGGGGGESNGTSGKGGDSYYGGGGGAGGNDTANRSSDGGNSVYGGGGGGGTHIGEGGISLYGGNGGAAANSTSGIDGTQPGGGGGATRTGPKAGNGGAGRCNVTTF